MFRVAVVWGLLLGVALAGASPVLAADTPGDTKAAPLPDGLKGFKGQVQGVLVAKGTSEFILKVDKIVRIWDQSTAPDPQAAVGKNLAIEFNPKSRWGEAFAKTLTELKVGDRVLCEPFEESGKLVLVETLKKVEAAPVEAPATVEQLKAENARLRAQNAELQAHNKALQDQLAALTAQVRDLQARCQQLVAEMAELKKVLESKR
jgi:cell division protein FtsB